MESYHMEPAEFRRWGHAVVDWVAGYMERVADLPVRPDVRPGDVRGKLPPDPPLHPEPFGDVLGDLDTVVLPGLLHWQSPRFFGYFPANSSGPSVLGELVSAGLAVQGMSWATSPACTEIETHVLDWLATMLDLPAAFRGNGVIQDTASSATLCALLAARERATAGAANRDGVPGGLVAYASAEAHSSVEKAVRIAGLGSAALRRVDVDGAWAMRPDALERAMAADAAAGRTPCFVVATVGTTSSNGMDPVRAVGEICRRHGAWLHVDAAMSGTAALCPEHRGIHDGLDLADSYCVNPHKWMFVNFDCDAFWVKDRAALTGALGLLPEYLKNPATDSGAVIDYRDWHVPLGRRFRALKLWFVIRHYGVEGLRFHVRQHVALAREFAAWVSADDRFELACEPPLNLVCFRHRGGEAATQAVLDRANASGRLFLTHTRLGGALTLRLCVGQTRTERRNVEEAWEVLRDAAG